MSQEKATVKKINEIFALNPRVPEYQRPYKWQIRHVQQLLNDLFIHFKDNKTYRIGTVVIHAEQGMNNIVDGQQRLVSLSLFLHIVGCPQKLLYEKFTHSISQFNIQENYSYLKSYVIENLSEENQAKFADYLLNTCEMVCVTLEDLDEAFQFFDSQNARGKPLEAYDLLKAYHLREMQDKPESIIHQSVSQWEKSALALENSPNLDKIINQLLFRLRRWQYGLESEVFTSEKLDTFKGISELDSKKFPYLYATLSATALSEFAKSNPLLFQSHFLTQGFQTNQPIINGEWFFTYIEYYRKIYFELFNAKTGKLCQIKKINQIDLGKNLIDFLDNYHGNSRTGDRYLRTLFENIVFAYYDKFGDNQLESFINKAFWWVYRLRLNYSRIGYVTMENEAISTNSLFKTIEKAYKPNIVLQVGREGFENKFDNIDNKFKEIFGVGANNGSN